MAFRIVGCSASGFCGKSPIVQTARWCWSMGGLLMKTSPSFQGLPGSSRRAPISSGPSSATISPTLKRVLIVDDSPLVRKALCGLLTLDGFSVCGEAGDGAQAIERQGKRNPT
jgi:hypothetical protein